MTDPKELARQSWANHYREWDKLRGVLNGPNFLTPPERHAAKQNLAFHAEKLDEYEKSCGWEYK